MSSYWFGLWLLEHFLCNKAYLFQQTFNIQLHEMCIHVHKYVAGVSFCDHRGQLVQCLDHSRNLELFQVQSSQLETQKDMTLRLDLSGPKD